MILWAIMIDLLLFFASCFFYLWFDIIQNVKVFRPERKSEISHCKRKYTISWIICCTLQAAVQNYNILFKPNVVYLKNSTTHWCSHAAVESHLQPLNLEAFEPKWVNPISNIIEVYTLRLGGLHLIFVVYIIVQFKSG